MEYQGFVGAAYTLENKKADAQRCLNYYLESIESGTGKEGRSAYLRRTPGLEKLLEVGSGPIRLVHFDNTPKSVLIPDTRVFVVSGNELYKLTFNSTAELWEDELMGEFDTSSGVIKAASATFDLGATVFVDGVNTYLYKCYDSGLGVVVEEFDDFAGFSYPTIERPVNVIWIDGYFIFCSSISNQFFVSDWNSLNVDPLSFASAEGDPDDIMGIISNQRNLFLINERTTEVWSNTGNADFPFERVQGGFFEKGCVASYSIAEIDGIVSWLGRDKSGQGIVYASSGGRPERISTHAIEQAIAGYEDISTATAYTYQDTGHFFYVLNFDEATWVFDFTTKAWHERGYTNDGEISRHRASFHSFIPEFGIHMLGDYEDSRIYQFNKDHELDDVNPISRIRVGPSISSGDKLLSHLSFQLDVQTGVGINGSDQGSDPQVVLQFSDDGGYTWSNEKWASLGQIGRRKTRVIWRRLGSSRNRIYRVICSEPVNIEILGAFIEVEGEAG